MSVELAPSGTRSARPPCGFSGARCGYNQEPLRKSGSCSSPDALIANAWLGAATLEGSYLTSLGSNVSYSERKADIHYGAGLPDLFRRVRRAWRLHVRTALSRPCTKARISRLIIWNK